MKDTFILFRADLLISNECLIDMLSLAFYLLNNIRHLFFSTEFKTPNSLPTIPQKFYPFITKTFYNFELFPENPASIRYEYCKSV